MISSGALSRLNPGQQRAVLAHERAHLRGRHHLILAVSAALARAFPVVPHHKDLTGRVISITHVLGEPDGRTGQHDADDPLTGGRPGPGARH